MRQFQLNFWGFIFSINLLEKLIRYICMFGVAIENSLMASVFYFRYLKDELRFWRRVRAKKLSETGNTY